jgi:predicted permease
VISSETLTHDPAAPYGGGVRAYWHRVSPGFFATLGLPLLGGRDFGPEDEGESSSSVIVSAALARRLWPGEDPLGQRVKPGSPDREAPWLTVVGVAAEVRYRDLAAGPGASPEDPDLYLPLRPSSYRNLAVAARTGLEPAQLSALMRRELAALDPGAVAYSLQTIDQRLAAETARSRFSTLLMGLFAGLALLLAGIGIYGVMTYSVGHRRREIGIRMALGAPGGRVVALIIGQGMLLVLAGAVLGLLGAFGLTRFLASLLHEVSASDPWIYLGMTATLAAVALLGCYLPARRASRVDPVAVLHEE